MKRSASEPGLRHFLWVRRRSCCCSTFETLKCAQEVNEVKTSFSNVEDVPVANIPPHVLWNTESNMQWVC